jgi:hypothetical protein
MPKDFSTVKMQEGPVQLDTNAGKGANDDADIIKKIIRAI